MTQQGRRRDKVERDGKVLHVTIHHDGTFTERDGRRWVHEQYTFQYHNPASGATFQSRFYAGMLYGEPNPWDALSANFLDARYLQDEADWRTSEGRLMGLQGERIEARLRRFLGGDYEFWSDVNDEVWQ